MCIPVHHNLMRYVFITIFQLIPDDRDTFESHPGAPLLAFQKLKMFMSRLQGSGLCFDITLTGAPTDPVYPQLLAQVSTETRHRGISWAPRPGSVSEETNDYELGPFMILTPGKVSIDKMSHRMDPLHSPTYEVTNATLKSAMRKFRHPLTESKKLIAICMCYFVTITIPDADSSSRSTLGKATYNGPCD